MKLDPSIRYLVIEGNIGAGKTSLARKLAHDTRGALLLDEFAENTFLPQFYKDPDKYAFPLELSFLAARFKQLLSHFKQHPNGLVISDYHIRKSLLFAEHNLQPAEMELFRSFFEMVDLQVREPELVIFLQKDVSKLQQNISGRGRSFEKNITNSYLEGINRAYDSFLKNHPFSKLLTIPSDELDFVNNESDYNLIINKIQLLFPGN